MSVRPALVQPEEGDPALLDLPVGLPLGEAIEQDDEAEQVEEPAQPEETNGLEVPHAEDDLSGLDGETHDDEVAPPSFAPDEPLHVAERTAGVDDDEPGPATSHDGEDGADELHQLEGESSADDDDLGSRGGEDDELASLDHDGRDDDAGAEGILGEDPSASLEEAPAIDGAEGEGEGLDEALPELREGPLAS